MSWDLLIGDPWNLFCHPYWLCKRVPEEVKRESKGWLAEARGEKVCRNSNHHWVRYQWTINQVSWHHDGQLEPSIAGGIKVANSAPPKCHSWHPCLQGRQRHKSWLRLVPLTSARFKHCCQLWLLGGARQSSSSVRASKWRHSHPHQLSGKKNYCQNVELPKPIRQFMVLGTYTSCLRDLATWLWQSRGTWGPSPGLSDQKFPSLDIWGQPLCSIYKLTQMWSWNWCLLW